FRGWQIHRLPSADDESYLVRTDYDVAVVPYAPEPAALEVGFRFLTRGVAVLDAIPRGVTASREPTGYTLTEYRHFVPALGATPTWPDGSPRPEVPLPALEPSIDAFGI